MIYIIVFLVLLVGILSYLVYNLWDKNRVYEEELEKSYLEYYQTISSVKTSLEDSRERLEKVDAKGSFKSDDEVGFVFNVIYNEIIDLNEYLKEFDGKEEEN